MQGRGPDCAFTVTPTATDAAAPGDAAAGHTQQSAHAALALVAAARAEADVIVNAIAALSSSTPSLALAPIAPRRATLASLAASRAGAVGGRSNWSEAFDAASGRAYWYDSSGQTTWVKPGGSGAPSGV